MEENKKVQQTVTKLQEEKEHLKLLLNPSKDMISKNKELEEKLANLDGEYGRLEDQNNEYELAKDKAEGKLRTVVRELEADRNKLAEAT